MPYRNEVRPLNLYEDFQAGRANALGRQADEQGNALRGMQLQRAQRLNALAPDATPEEYMRAGDVQTGAALAGYQQNQQADKRQSLARAGSIAKQALSIQDPAMRKGFLQQAISTYGQDFAALGSDMSQVQQMLALPDEKLLPMLQQASQFAPQSEDAYTLGKNEKRFVGGREVAANIVPEGTDANGFTLSPEQIRFDAQGQPIARGAPKAAPSKPELFDVASKLRGEYNAQSKEFTGVADSYQRIRDSAADPSPAGDLSLIFNFMKVLDPGSTVREGEFATAQNAGSVPSRIYAQYNKVMSGERLAPDQRADFVGRATKLYKGQEERFNTRVKGRYEGLAKRYGLDPAEVLSDPSASVAGPDAAQNVPSATGPNGQKIYFRNGQWGP